MEISRESGRVVLKSCVGGVLVLFISVVFLASCSLEKDSSSPGKDSLTINYTVRGAWPHDPKAFTEGFLIHDEKVYESTGKEKQSWIAIVDVETGDSDKKIILDKKYFGEGIAIINNKIYQLTYQTKIGFVYDLKTFKKIREFKYNTEGWGMTDNGENLIMSDGSDKLFFLDTATLEIVKTLPVYDEDGKVEEINELEYINGFIYANVWRTDMIIRIDPVSGKVTGRMDLGALVEKARQGYPAAEVLNGIAYHRSTKSILVTGKYWPSIYILKLDEPDAATPQ